MREYRRRRGGGFRRRRHRRRRRHAGRAAGRSRVFGRRHSMPARISVRWKTSPPTRRSRTSSIGPTSASSTATIRSRWAARTAARRWAARTVHFAMVSLRFRPEWFKSRSVLGYGADWPLDWRDMWGWYGKAERALSISGPTRYPWGPKRPRYPYRAARDERRRRSACAGLRGDGDRLDADAAGHGFGAAMANRRPASIAASAGSGARPTPSRASWSPSFREALAAGAEIRDLAMVGRIETDRNGRATGVHYHPRRPMAFPEGQERGGRRLCHRNAAAAAGLGRRALSRWPGQQLRPRRQEPDGAVQPGGLRRDGGRGALVQRAAVARHHRALELRRPQGLSSAAIAGWRRDRCRSNGSAIQTSARGLWGQALRDEMEKYNHQVGVEDGRRDAAQRGATG